MLIPEVSSGHWSLVLFALISSQSSSCMKWHMTKSSRKARICRLWDATNPRRWAQTMITLIAVSHISYVPNLLFSKKTSLPNRRRCASFFRYHPSKHVIELSSGMYPLTQSTSQYLTSRSIFESENWLFFSQSFQCVGDLCGFRSSRKLGIACCVGDRHNTRPHNPVYDAPWRRSASKLVLLNELFNGTRYGISFAYHLVACFLSWIKASFFLDDFENSLKTSTELDVQIVSDAANISTGYYGLLALITR